MEDNRHDRLMTLSEVAGRMQVHPTSVKRIFAANKGPAPVRIGARDRYYESRFNEWLESCTPARRDRIARAARG
jgi:predicted DNA-binding transcriptional regulator AlpA